jgi:hypothetical protein
LNPTDRKPRARCDSFMRWAHRFHCFSRRHVAERTFDESDSFSATTFRRAATVGHIVTLISRIGSLRAARGSVPRDRSTRGTNGIDHPCV